MDARRRNVSALRLRFSQSLASRRHRLSQAMVRSTTRIDSAILSVSGNEYSFGIERVK